MARKLQVQRTMTVCVATVMCYNTQDGTTCDREYITPKDYPNEHKLLKACQAYLDRKDESNPLKPVHLKHKHYEKRSYSMPLEVYIDTADITSKEEVLKKRKGVKNNERKLYRNNQGKQQGAYKQRAHQDEGLDRST